MKRGTASGRNARCSCRAKTRSRTARSRQPTPTCPAETILFAWHGALPAQEIYADKTVPYLYEPDSFVPLARIESDAGIDSDTRVDTHLEQNGRNELPVAR
ncbi:hypothetical protein [Massilia scottii]|uniref:hypothetical protein n=1 Tax=Massilia scottii TaxID=3057166 RepID=UPI0027968460|nr:hypothetical protein [Massilia sp. CCM 9029]MDQ1832395.1 hypothetical protein [Massilia sp. CCM 9029]